MSSTDFSLAQQRLAARRRQRDSEILARRNRQVDSAAHFDSRLPSSLRGLGSTGSKAWSAINGREGTRPAFRVGQVDAELLDEELLGLFKGQVGEALKYLGSHLADDWSPEISLVLRAILFKLSVWDHNATYGAALQNLRFTDARCRGPTRATPSKWQKVVYGIFTVGGTYAWGKWDEWLIDQQSGTREATWNIRILSRATSLVSTGHSIAALVSFLIFLTNGRYRTLLDRILRLRLTPPTGQVRREVSFEYLNRQLVWHAFTEFLLFVLPLVGIARWRRWLAQAWRRAKAVFKRRAVEAEDEKTGGELSFLPERTCAICYQDQNTATSSEIEILAASGSGGGVIGSAQTDITNPYETIPCGCVYCFVCIAQRLEAEEGISWQCLRCGTLVKECKPWHADVLEEIARPASSGKSVGFATEDVNESHEANQLLRELPPTPEVDHVAEDLEQVATSRHREKAHAVAGSGDWSDLDAAFSAENSDESESEQPALSTGR